MYLSSEVFINEFIDAIQHNNLVKFRKRYRQADLLLIDDIQFLGGKERSQEEFFHTFNTLFDGHKQIVLSSDRPPSEIANLEHRLVSRFEWGLTAELQAPDTETRVAILRRKAEERGSSFQPGVLETVAKIEFPNVRELMGALNRIVAFQAVNDTPINAEAVRKVLGVRTGDAPTTAGSPVASSAAGSADEFSQFLTDVTFTVGKAVEALVTCETGSVSYVVVGSGGVGGIAETLRAVARADIEFACDSLTLRRDSAWFEALPTLDDGDWPAAAAEFDGAPAR
jgi:hypothetical protein